MHERTSGAFHALPTWKRVVIAVPIICVVLIFAWAVIAILFAFATKLAIGVAVIATLLILLAAIRFVLGAGHSR
jgi:hypothetical protein